jgi:hypothetical protein
MAEASPGPRTVFGPDPKKTCKDCGNPGHPSKRSPFCPQTTSIKARGREYGGGDGNEFYYRPFVFKCRFTKFCRDPAVDRVLRNVVDVTSRVRFEASRFLHLFLTRISGKDLTANPIKDASIDQLLLAFYRP